MTSQACRTEKKILGASRLLVIIMVGCLRIFYLIQIILNWLKYLNALRQKKSRHFLSNILISQHFIFAVQPKYYILRHFNLALGLKIEFSICI